VKCFLNFSSLIIIIIIVIWERLCLFIFQIFSEIIFLWHKIIYSLLILINKFNIKHNNNNYKEILGYKEAFNVGKYLYKHVSKLHFKYIRII